MKPDELAFLKGLVDDACNHVREHGVAVEVYQEEDDHVKVRLFEPKPGDLDPAENNVLAEVHSVTVNGFSFLMIVFADDDKVWVSAMHANAGQSLAGILLVRH